MKPRIVFLTGKQFSDSCAQRINRNNLFESFDIKAESHNTLSKYDTPTTNLIFNALRQKYKYIPINDAYNLIAQFEDVADVTVVTENLDDFHERAGSTDVIHLYGELFKAKSSVTGNVIPWYSDITPYDKCEYGGNLVPLLLDPALIKEDPSLFSYLKCDILVVINSAEIRIADLINATEIFFLTPTELYPFQKNYSFWKDFIYTEEYRYHNIYNAKITFNDQSIEEGLISLYKKLKSESCKKD